MTAGGIGPDAVPIDADIHVVVFDVNVWLDAGRIVGPDFTWSRFEEIARGRARNFVASWDRQGGDSLVALWIAHGGMFVEGQPIEIWSSDHIENLIFKKATQPNNPKLHEDDRGLGWSWTQANSLLTELHDRFVPQAQVARVLGEPPVPPAGSYALSREDGLVAATAMEAGNHYDIKYCVTKDRGFRELGDPEGKILVQYPHEFVQLIRDSRRALSPTPRPRP